MEGRRGRRSDNDGRDVAGAAALRAATPSSTTTATLAREALARGSGGGKDGGRYCYGRVG